MVRIWLMAAIAFSFATTSIAWAQQPQPGQRLATVNVYVCEQDGQNVRPIAGAQVGVEWLGGAKVEMTNDLGRCVLTLPSPMPIEAHFVASAQGYQPWEMDQEVTGDFTLIIFLEKIPPWHINVVVDVDKGYRDGRIESGDPSGFTVTVAPESSPGTLIDWSTTDAAGETTVSGRWIGKIWVTVIAPLPPNGWYWWRTSYPDGSGGFYQLPADRQTFLTIVSPGENNDITAVFHLREL